MVMGTENYSMKIGSVPSFPGKTKSNRDQSSFRLFCMGEPDRMYLWGVRNCGGRGGGIAREGTQLRSTELLHIVSSPASPPTKAQTMPNTGRRDRPVKG